jgi:hypothetical protein
MGDRKGAGKGTLLVAADRRRDGRIPLRENLLLAERMLPPNR